MLRPSVIPLQMPNELLLLAADGFTKGSNMGKPRVKLEIWSSMDGFKLDLHKTIYTANKLAVIAKGGDEAATMEQFKALGCAKSNHRPLTEGVVNGNDFSSMVLP